MTAETTAVTLGATGPGRGGRVSRQRKRDAVLRLLRGKDLEMVSRSPGVTAATPSGWRDAFLAAGKASLATRATGGEGLESERLKARLGEMLLERELLEAKVAALENGRPLVRRSLGHEPRRLLQQQQVLRRALRWPFHQLRWQNLRASSARVCWVWNVARATVYRHRLPPRSAPPRPRGPSGSVPDAALAEAIRAVLSASPFHGDGHRKVWARHFNIIGELRQALLLFQHTYNTIWLIERHGFQPPAAVRRQQI